MVKSTLKIALSLVLVFSISAEAQCPNAGSSEDGSAQQASEGDTQAFMAQRKAQMMQFMQQSGQQVDFSSMAAAASASGQQRRKKRSRRGGNISQPKDPIMQPLPVDPPVVIQPAPAPAETPSAGSGSSSNSGSSSSSAVTFATLTQKVLSVNCNECHSNFSNYNTVKNKANSILSMSEGGHGNLTNEQLDVLRAWIDGGKAQ